MQVDTETGFRTKAVLCCPMIDPKGNLVAVLQAINPLHGGTFSDRDLRLIRCMQMPLAIALLNARLHSSLRNANESSATLVRVANALHSELTSVTSGSSGATQGSLNSLMDKVVREAKERFAADRCSMYVCDASRNEIWSLVAMGLTERFRVPIGKGIAGRCAETGEAINVVDASSDARVFKTDIGGYVMRNTLCVPIIDRRETLADGRPKIIGVVQLLNKLKAPNHFTLQDEEALEGFCNIVGLAMQNAITFDAVREKEETTSHILSSISSYICKARLLTAAPRPPRHMPAAPRDRPRLSASPTPPRPSVLSQRPPRVVQPVGGAREGDGCAHHDDARHPLRRVGRRRRLALQVGPRRQGEAAAAAPAPHRVPRQGQPLRRARRQDSPRRDRRRRRRAVPLLHIQDRAALPQGGS